ncbi:GTPase IMAP family member 4-like [Cottoperca gobio]|uniref:GTPase IMAP family member 4-like n=1 Tax=Cottoperca gobio TaxID=56716 RepID=A0A6J2RM76_COTGO|nr:GTPase IMAP family member 4-like [Cottoperca gobio]
MECQCDKDNPEDTGWWMSTNNVQMGAFTVVGYLLYRFSQTLPALIRWPIRLFCSLTGLSTLWSWVSHLVGTLRGIQSLCKWLSRVWRFIAASSSKFKWLVAVVTGSEMEPTGSTNKPGLRLILLGLAGGGRTSLADTLLGHRETSAPTDPRPESSKRRTVMDGRELIVIDTPDVLGSSLGRNKRATEALRSLQLASPGPHAILVVIQAPGSSFGIDHDAAQAVLATLELFGEGAAGHIIPVLTHADRLGQKQSVDSDSWGVVSAIKAELVDNGPDCPPEAKSVVRRQLVERVMEVETLKGHFVHELQRREERVREKLLEDMSAGLAAKLH